MTRILLQASERHRPVLKLGILVKKAYAYYFYTIQMYYSVMVGYLDIEEHGSKKKYNLFLPYVSHLYLLNQVEPSMGIFGRSLFGGLIHLDVSCLIGQKNIDMVFSE